MVLCGRLVRGSPATTARPATAAPAALHDAIQTARTVTESDQTAFRLPDLPLRL